MLDCSLARSKLLCNLSPASLTIGGNSNSMAFHNLQHTITISQAILWVKLLSTTQLRTEHRAALTILTILYVL